MYVASKGNVECGLELVALCRSVVSIHPWRRSAHTLHYLHWSMGRRTAGVRGWHQVLAIVLLVSHVVWPHVVHADASTSSSHPAKSSLDSAFLCIASTLPVPRMR